MSEGRWELGDTEYDLSLRESYYKGEKIEPGLEGRNEIGRRRERGHEYIDFIYMAQCGSLCKGQFFQQKRNSYLL